MIQPYFNKDGFSLYLSDCLAVLSDLPENSVDMVFADHPYFLSSGSFSCHSGKRVSVKKGDWDLSSGVKKNFEFHIQWIKACKRILSPTAQYG